MSEYSEKMDKAIEATEREFSKIRAGQASPAILNDVRIDYYGTPTPISQVAKVSVPNTICTRKRCTQPPPLYSMTIFSRHTPKPS